MSKDRFLWDWDPCRVPKDMPRYCAVKVCRNRGGGAARTDSRRISFYPFPLQDKPRLQKWVDNMRREEWTPSRHQYLCSEHFTQDSFDIRWGIRYLRTTAVPTIFPSAEDDCEKVATIGRRSEPESIPVPSVTEPAGSDSPLSERPLVLSRTCEEVQSCESGDAVSRHAEVTEAVCLFEVPLVPDAAAAPSDLCDVQSPGDGGEAAPLSASSVAVLCCHSLNTVMDGEVKAAAALQSGLSFVPLEIVRDQPAGALWAGGGGGGGEEEHASLYEHSYCRPDTDKDQLWSKILALHAKILELDRREESTVAKIQALEAEVALLKRDGAVFKEKQKVVEDYISSLLL